MTDFARDRALEKARYSGYAKQALNSTDADVLGPDGALSIPLELRAPYLVYEGHIRRLIQPGQKLLDVCCGSGVHSLTGAYGGAHVTCSDIVEANLELARRRAGRVGLVLDTVIADAEVLPFPSVSLDIVTCAGSLSYVDHGIFFREVKRVLKPGGYFICVDSLSHNPIYRLNRYLQYLVAKRSKSTLLRMPRHGTVIRMGEVLGEVAASYHGIFSFASPIIKPILGAKKTARFLDGLDRMVPILGRHAFKFVAIARKTAA